MNKVEIYDSIVKELREIYVAKNNDYGDSVSDTYKKFGDVSFVVRITDKINRVTSLLKAKEQLVLDEKIDDTIKDMVNYGLLWLIEKEAEKLEKDTSK